MHLTRITPIVAFSLLMTLACVAITPNVASGKPQDEDSFVEVLQLQNADVNGVMQAITVLLAGSDTNPMITADVRTNRIVFRGTKEELEAIKAVVTALDTPAPKADESPNLLSVYHLKYIEASTAFNVLQSVMAGEPDIRIAVDQNVNGLVVHCDEIQHQKVENLIQALDAKADVEVAAPTTRTVSTSDLGTNTREKMELAHILAKNSDLNMEYVPGLDVFVVRGRDSDFQNFANELSEALTDIAESQETTKSYSVLVGWWMSQDAAPNTESDSDDMRAIRRQAAQYGIKNLERMGQLIATTSVETNSSAKFVVEGDIDLFQNDEEASLIVPLTAEGSLGIVDPDKGSLALSLTVSAANSRADVDLQLKEGNPIIMAAMPVDSLKVKGHSLFVVEVVEQK